MKLNKAAGRTATRGKQDKLLMWAVCCIAFSGSCRAGELLGIEKVRFDPATTLLKGNLDLDNTDGTRSVQVKWAKQDRAGQGFAVEVYETGSTICPVRVLEKCWEPRAL